jgi:multiple antibiotic resistance protein
VGIWSATVDGPAGKESTVFQEFTATLLVVVAGLFPVINPPAAGFIILSLVPDATPAQRADLARRVTINSFLLLLGALSVGAYVLSFFGVSIPVLRVAGGLVIGSAGWNLLHSPADERKAHPVPPDEAVNLGEQAFYPLTLPITVGPGSIAVAIALATGWPGEGPAAPHVAGVGVALVLLCASIYLCVRYAAAVERVLGAVGSRVAMRLFAFILFCIGVQIFWLGLSELLRSLPPR